MHMVKTIRGKSRVEFLTPQCPQWLALGKDLLLKSLGLWVMAFCVISFSHACLFPPSVFLCRGVTVHPWVYQLPSSLEFFAPSRLDFGKGSGPPLLGPAGNSVLFPRWEKYLRKTIDWKYSLSDAPFRTVFQSLVAVFGTCGALLPK